ncbi:MAG: hypothetical protein V1824_04245 [archaeon]
MFQKFQVLENKIKDKLISHLFSRYGIDKQYFKDYEFYKHENSVYLLSKKYCKAVNINLKDKQLFNVGLEIFADYKKYLPSSIGFEIFKTKQIKQNFVVLDRGQAISYFQNKELEVNKIKEKNILSDGYLIVIYNNYIIGTIELKNKSTLFPNLSFVNYDVK